MELHNLKKVYCAGIGGIGLSAVARMLVDHSVEVYGSDTSATVITEKLEAKGIKIFFDDQSTVHLEKDTDLVLYSTALSNNNPDFVFAKENDIPMMTYPEILGVISKNKKTIQITGTHGKTTTTAMTAGVLIDAKVDPTVIVGSLMNTENGQTNYVEGSSEYFVLESCEYERSFRHVTPFIHVITNIEEDHLDYYRDLSDIQAAFHDVAKKIPKEGALICNPNDPKVAPVLTGLPCEIIDYTKIDVSDLELRVPGEHNKQNAQCAAAVANFLHLDQEQIMKGLENFKGTWRRFEYKGELNSKAKLYDDYAHHPTEIRSALEGFREAFPDKKITLVFHPHLYSRTKELKDDFILELSKADRVILAPIFPARESFDPSINSGMLADGIEKHGTSTQNLESFDEIVQYIEQNTNKEDVVVTMGAGDIYKIAENLL